jgi:hypothetical protein
MAFGDDELDLSARIKRVLLETRYPISYGALTRGLNVPGPGAIARVTAALEALMREDAAAGRPFLAAMCEGKLSGGMPALGFFQMAVALGRYTGPATGPEAAAFVAAERALLAKG